MYADHVPKVMTLGSELVRFGKIEVMHCEQDEYGNTIRGRAACMLVSFKLRFGSEIELLLTVLTVILQLH